MLRVLRWRSGTVSVVMAGRHRIFRSGDDKATKRHPGAVLGQGRLMRSFKGGFLSWAILCRICCLMSTGVSLRERLSPFRYACAQTMYRLLVSGFKAVQEGGHETQG